jgi:hypothetical protein
MLPVLRRASNFAGVPQAFLNHFELQSRSGDAEMALFRTYRCTPNDSRSADTGETFIMGMYFELLKDAVSGTSSPYQPSTGVPFPEESLC